MEARERYDELVDDLCARNDDVEPSQRMGMPCVKRSGKMVAGFAKGSAKVALEEDGGETIMRYGVQAQVGGKLAQIGSRLVDGTARKLADQFFDRFAAAVNPESDAASQPAAST